MKEIENMARHQFLIKNMSTFFARFAAFGCFPELLDLLAENANSTLFYNHNFFYRVTEHIHGGSNEAMGVS